MVDTREHQTSRLNVSGSMTEPERELQACVNEQSVVFEAAVSVIERLETAAAQRNLGNPDSVGQLQKSLDLVVAAQQRVSAAYSRFNQGKGILTTDLRATLGRHEALLKALISRIDHLQHTFEDVRSELIPQIDAESRQRNMQAAYQKSMRSL
jgi:hypothetical protein